MTQTQAAERIGLSQPDVSRLLRGQFRDVSVERFMRMLSSLGYDVDIVIRSHRQTLRFPLRIR
jgi:predicted XRE-type DNA-binding protein